MSKFLILAENIDEVITLCNNIFFPDFKIITEYELLNDHRFSIRFSKVGYSDYIVGRASVTSKIYKFRKPLIMILDQRHQDAVQKVENIASIRIYKNDLPKRIFDAITYKTDILIKQEEFTADIINGLIA